MNQSVIQTDLIAGAGSIALGVAHCLAVAGFRTVVLSRDPARIRAQLPDAVAAVDLWPPDLLIEWVREETEIRLRLYREIVAAYCDKAVLGSNTSYLALEGLGRPLAHPARFPGIRYLCPADSTELVEVRRTPDAYRGCGSASRERRAATVRQDAHRPESPSDQCGHHPAVVRDAVRGLLRDRRRNSHARTDGRCSAQTAQPVHVRCRTAGAVGREQPGHPRTGAAKHRAASLQRAAPEPLPGRALIPGRDRTQGGTRFLRLAGRRPGQGSRTLGCQGRAHPSADGGDRRRTRKESARMSRLLSSFGACGVALRNRVVVSHMAQYCAGAGKATDWSFAHLAAFATGSAALVFTESTQVEWPGLGSRDELYLWNDKHLESPRRITRFVRQAGAVPGTQLNHSGRMARAQRPWAGYDPRQSTERQLSPVIAPSACRHGERQARPREITRAYVREVIDAWVASTQLAVRAGFEVLEIYGAEGHLLHQFLAAAANHRTDERDGALANRMRSALEPTDAVRAFRPRDLPLFLRLSSTDDIGWTLDDSVALAAEHRACNVDVIDCSSGRMASRSPTTPNTSRGLSYQVPYATRIKRDAGIATMAVVLIARPQQAERILQEDASSLVELGREALLHPYWAGHAADALGADRDFGGWPRQYGWWLERRSRAENLDPEPTARSNSQE